MRVSCGLLDNRNQLLENGDQLTRYKHQETRYPEGIPLGQTITNDQ